MEVKMISSVKFNRQHRIYKIVKDGKELIVSARVVSPMLEAIEKEIKERSLLVEME